MSVCLCHSGALYHVSLYHCHAQFAVCCSWVTLFSTRVIFSSFEKLYLIFCGRIISQFGQSCEFAQSGPFVGHARGGLAALLVAKGKVKANKTAVNLQPE